MLANKEKSFVSAVAYVHNNKSSIEEFLETVYGVLKENFENFEIILVNDHSDDGSIDIIKEFSSKNKGSVISIINMSIPQGVELSMNAGVDLAIGDFIFEFDSVIVDYQPNDIIRVYKQSLEGYDIVSFSPSSNVPFSSKLFYQIFNNFSKAKYRLQTDRFRILSRRSINRINSISKSIMYRKAAYANSGLNVTCITYKPDTRKSCTESHARRKEKAISSLIMYTDIAYKVSMILTFLFFAFTASTIMYTIYIYLGEQKPIEGWTTIMFLVSSGLSGIFLIFAIIIKYLSIIVELILKKQKYLIESIEKMS